MEPANATSGPAERPPFGSVGFLLSQLGWATAARFRETLAPLGLDPRQFAMLRALAGREGQSQVAVCGALHIPPSRMVALVDDLEERGLVERRLNALDRRARAIHLTDAGRDLLQRAFARAREHESWVSKPLSPTEREQLLGLLDRLVDHYGLSREVHADLTTARPQPWPGAPETPGN